MKILSVCTLVVLELSLIACKDKSKKPNPSPEEDVNPAGGDPSAGANSQCTALVKQIKFDPDPTQATITVGTPYEFKGSVPSGVAKIELLIDDWTLNKGSPVATSDGKFSISYKIFFAKQNRKLQVRGFDDKDTQIGECQYRINVKDK